jgi:NTP pyrophosphatase (non-canonical NTP hydrolase)
MEIAALQEAAVAFAREREWQSFHDPKNLAMALASEVGELNAILRWVPSSDSDNVVAGADVRTRVEQEIGDIAILLLLLCARTRIEFARAVTAKLALNSKNYPVTSSMRRADRPASGEAT